MEEVLIETPKELEALSERVLSGVKTSKDATVLALHGELGAGKTAFVQALARTLGISSFVPSPTFIVMRTYSIENHPQFRTLIHIDAYRIASLDELRVLKFNDLLSDAQNLIAIEWAGKIENALPEDALHISFSRAHIYGDGETRKVEYGYHAQ